MEIAETRPTSAGLDAALAELDESTARLIDLRHSIVALAAGVAERRQALQGLEQELSVLDASADADRALVSSLERDVDGREEVLGRVRTELAALVGDLGFGSHR
jgi:uncharacterized protein (DUF3084 family)